MKEFKKFISEISVSDYFSKSKEDQKKIADAEKKKAPAGSSLSDLKKVPKGERQNYLDQHRQKEVDQWSKSHSSTYTDVNNLLKMLKTPIDWDYKYSDDHSLWRKTQDQIDDILVAYKRLSAEHKIKVNPYMKKAGFKV